VIRWVRGLFGVAAVALLAAAARAAPADGELVAERPCVRPAVSYDAYVAAQVKGYQDEAELAAKAHVRVRPAADYAKALQTRAEYEARQAWPSACRRILYGSDGLKVSGFVWEPHERPAAAKLPVVVALRGGNQEFGKWGPNAKNGMAALTDAGFIVIGVQYRGVDGGEGQEEFGGADVHDVLSAIALARRLPEADGRNVFLEGTSRGGMEAMLALGAGAQVNAAALISPWTDLELEARLRPAVAAEVWAKLIPNYAADPVAARASRSGVRIAQTKDLPPLLLMHGTADWRASPQNATEVADALKARGRPYALHIFPDDVHGLSWNWRERDRLEVAWFKSHMR
jgi:dipeptidyl aminopeptidase/acylaminoacyl peptidase